MRNFCSTHTQFYQIVNGKRNKKKRTKSTYQSDPSNPSWNESFSFNFPPDYVQNCAFEVWELFCEMYCSIRLNLFTIPAQIYVMTTGGESNALSCCIGPQEAGSGKEHWLDVTHPATQKPTAQWHSLR